MSCGSYCNGCSTCLKNCDRCPTKSCQAISIHQQNAKKINKQVRMSGSLQIYKKKAATISRMVGQSATPKMLLQAGGPGDLISAFERQGRKNGVGAVSAVELRKTTYNMGSLRNRTAPRGKTGVDKKHGSYARFLARKIGGVLRKDQMPSVRQRKAYIHQPRNRTGTTVSCRPQNGGTRDTKTKQFFALGRYQRFGNGESNKFSICDSSGCCDERIPQVETVNGKCSMLSQTVADKWNSGNTDITGACGSKTQLGCVPTKCRSCSHKYQK